jgi:hypothetical protein
VQSEFGHAPRSPGTRACPSLRGAPSLRVLLVPGGGVPVLILNLVYIAKEVVLAVAVHSMASKG